MPGTGRPGDPLWMAIGFAIGVIPGIWLHQVYAGLGSGWLWRLLSDEFERASVGSIAGPPILRGS